jgi:hypothetical protein
LIGCVSARSGGAWITPARGTCRITAIVLPASRGDGLEDAEFCQMLEKALELARVCDHWCHSGL